MNSRRRATKEPWHAAALGVAAPRAGRHVVVVTVDPARRLADALGLECRRKGHGSGVRSAPAQRGDSPLGGHTLKASDNRDLHAFAEFLQDILRRDFGDPGAGMGIRHGGALDAGALADPRVLRSTNQLVTR